MKPRIKQYHPYGWVCYGRAAMGYGPTPLAAYRDWQRCGMPTYRPEWNFDRPMTVAIGRQLVDYGYPSLPTR